MTLHITADEIHDIKQALEDYQMTLQDARHCARKGSSHLIAGYDRDIEAVAALRAKLRHLRQAANLVA